MTLCESYSKDCGFSILQSSSKKVFIGLSKGYIEKVGLGEGEGSSKGVRPRSSQSCHKKLFCDTPGESSSQKPDISACESSAEEFGLGLGQSNLQQLRVCVSESYTKEVRVSLRHSGGEQLRLGLGDSYNPGGHLVCCLTSYSG